jgi:GT2 family glycosyltransferase
MPSKNSSDPIVVSIIIVDFHGQQFWSELLKSLAEQDFTQFEIVVVDNGGGLSLPGKIGDAPIRLVRSSGNIGFAAGCNLGMKHSRGNFLVMLNNDTVVMPNWLSSLVERAKTERSIGAVGSKIVFYSKYVSVCISSPVFCPFRISGADDRRNLGIKLFIKESWDAPIEQFMKDGFHPIESNIEARWAWTKGAAEIWLPKQPGNNHFVLEIETPRELRDREVTIECGGQRKVIIAEGNLQQVNFDLEPGDSFDVINNGGSSVDRNLNVTENGVLQRDCEEFSTPKVIDALCGCSFLIKREILEDELFDEAFFAYYEDTDLSLRLKHLGYKLWYEPKSVVRHVRSGTSKLHSSFLRFHGYRNRVWLIAKHGGFLLILRTLFWSLLFPKEKIGGLDREYSKRKLICSCWTGSIRYLVKRMISFSRAR